MAEVRVRFDNVSAGYGSTAAASNVSGEVLAGDAVAIIGPNGAGKTTLMRSIVGLVDVIGGTLTVDGKDPLKVRGDVAYVPQAATLDRTFPVSVLDVVLMGRYRKLGWLRRPGAKDRQAALDAMREVNIADRANDHFGTLSGGQRQRVLIARALAQQSDLLLLDEPFNGVDKTTVEISLGVIRRLREKGVAVIMSTHDLEVARAVCNKALLMNNKQFGFGPIESTLTADLLSKTFGTKSMHWSDSGSVVTTG